MGVRFRAFVALAMLIGVYVLSLSIVAAMGAGIVWILRNSTSHGAGKVVFLLGGVAVGVCAALWRALRAKPEPPEGMPLAESAAPELWAQVRALAAEVGTRAPDEIRLITDVNAAVVEDATFLGLRPGKRYLYLGAPLLLTFTVDQLRSVLAHELGHYSGGDTRLGSVVQLGRITLLHTASQFESWNPVGWLLRGYFRLYLLVTQAMSRKQEYQADVYSARLAGRDTAIGALRELPVLAVAYQGYLNRYVAWGVEQGYGPSDLFGGFRQYAAARSGELAELRANPEPEEHSRWDSHPPIADRVAALARMDAPWRMPDTREAGALVPDLRGVIGALERFAFDFGNRPLLPWPDFTLASAGVSWQHHVDPLYRVAARIVGAPTGNLTTVLDLLAAARGNELAAGLRGQGDDLALRVESAVELVAIGAGAARWQPSWSAPLGVVGTGGEPFALSALAQRAATDPATVAELRGRLAALGVAEAAGVQVAAQADARTAEALGAIANVRINGVEQDLVVTDQGLIFTPSGDSNAGKARLVRLLEVNQVAALAARYNWLPFEEVAAARLVKSVPIQFELTLRDGQVLAVKESWSSELLGKNIRELVEVQLRSLNAG